jgi:hypothetical protein
VPARRPEAPVRDCGPALDLTKAQTLDPNLAGSLGEIVGGK